MTDSRGRVRLTALALLLAVWALLVWRLDAVPPGFQHDQTFNTQDALDTLRGAVRLYYPANFGREPLGILLGALGLALAGGVQGHIVWGLRFGSVFAGMLAVTATLTLARRYLSYGGALLAAGLLAGSFWLIFAARLGLEPMLVTPCAAAMVYFLSRGLSRGRQRDWFAAGLLGAAAVYSYLAGRVLFGLAPVLLVHEAVAAWLARLDGGQAALRRRNMAGLALSWGVMLAACAPLLWHIRQNTGVADERVRELGGPLQALLRGDFAPVLARAGEAASSLVWSGSTAIPYHYNLPGRPALSPVLAVLFLVGLALTAWRWLGRPGRPHAGEFLLLAALALGMAPVGLTGADALYMRGVVALPLLFVLAARGAEGAAAWVGRALGWTQDASPAWARILAVGLAIALVAGQWAESGQAYFVRWAGAEQTQRIYNADFRAAARLPNVPGDEATYIGTDRLLDLDAATYSLYAPARPDARWFYLPDNPPLPRQGSARYLIPGESGPLPPVLELLQPDATIDETLLGPNGDYGLLRVLRLSSNAVDTLLAERRARPPESIPSYGDALKLTAAGVQDNGRSLDIITEWEVIGPWPFRPPPGEAPTSPKLAVSLYDDTGYRWTQMDVAATMPYRTWQPGDRILEPLVLPVPGDIPPGDYTVRLAVYDDRGGSLPARSGDTAASSDAAIARVTLTAGTDRADAPPAPYPIESVAGGVLEPLGRWEPLDELVSGVPADLHVSWRARDALATTAGMVFRMRATDATGALLWEQDATPVEPLPQVWPAGQVYRLTHQVQPETAQEGMSEAILSLCANAPGASLVCTEVARPQVANRPPLTELSILPHTTSDARWEHGMTLAGYDLTRVGDGLDLTLYWRVESTPGAELKRFVHAVGGDGAMLAQSDARPDNGGLPMTAWRPGEYVIDRVTLPVAGAASQVRVGWYDPATGMRVSVQDTLGNITEGGYLVIAAP